VSSSEACPAACGECAAECADSTSWHYKKAKNTCGAYVSKKSKTARGRGRHPRGRRLRGDVRGVLMLNLLSH
jgi:hypothetical protein